MDSNGKKNVLITGGEGDLAQAIKQELAEGFIVSTPGRYMLDVTSETSLVNYVKRLEKMDLLVCNAGVLEDAVLMKMSPSAWENVLDVNLKGAFLSAQAVLEKMTKDHSGHIIFISSYSALCPPVGQANYAAAKAGLIGLAKSLAKEYGGFGVRINVVLPGWLETKMTLGQDKGQVELVKNEHVLGELNTVKEVAKFIKFLHCEMGKTSGQVFQLDSRISP